MNAGDESEVTFLQTGTPEKLEQAVAKNHVEWLVLKAKVAGGEVYQAEDIKELLVNVLKAHCVSERFSIDDERDMDFFAAWAYVQLTGDEEIVDRLKDPINNFLEKGGHPMRRLHFLGYLDEKGDEPINVKLFLSEP
tara:strand:- start:2838 stop:3248 length:411 start_codon:yes stop_codon:yes gene_type:complete